ncbi:hypothetical protein GGI35DRAFT_85623 [Trichoderma velutinum]
MTTTTTKTRAAGALESVNRRIRGGMVTVPTIMGRGEDETLSQKQLKEAVTKRHRGLRRVSEAEPAAPSSATAASAPVSTRSSGRRRRAAGAGDGRAAASEGSSVPEAAERSSENGHRGSRAARAADPTAIAIRAADAQREKRGERR